MHLRYPVLAFFVLTFAISGAAAGPYIASVHGLLSLQVPPVLGLLAAIGPGLAAVLTVALEQGSNGVRQFLRSSFEWRCPVIWYLVAFALPLMLLAATFALNSWFGAPFPSVAQRLRGLPALLLLLTLQVGLGEELGWRGFAQVRLQRRWSLVPAALVVGAVWSAWHLALFLIPDSMQWQLWHAVGAITAVGGYSLHIVLTAILYALAMSASGSVLIPMLLHGATNAGAWLFALNDVAHQGVRPTLLLTVLEAAIVLVWLVIDGHAA